MAAIASEAVGGDIPQHYPPRSAVISWIFFDWAAQPYFTLITTFVFAPYFASFVAPDPATGQALWGFATAAAGLAIALMSPVLGAIADASGRRKPWIAGFGALLVIGSASMWIGRPGDPSVIAPLLLAYAVASVGAEFATVFNNAMMPTLVPPERIGRLSGTGWATGYIGGILSLVIVLGFLAANPDTGRTLFGLSPLFGLDAVTHEGDRIERQTVVAAAIGGVLETATVIGPVDLYGAPFGGPHQVDADGRCQRVANVLLIPGASRCPLRAGKGRFQPLLGRAGGMRHTGQRRIAELS